MPDTKPTDTGRRVEVTRDGVTVEALDEPAFIVKHGDRYFLTLALWEYEQGPDQTPEQQDGVAEIIKLYNTALLAGEAREAVRIPDTHPHIVYTQIKPHPPTQ